MRQVRLKLVAELASVLEPTLLSAYRDNLVDLAYAPDTTQTGRRALRNAALAFLANGQRSEGTALAHRQYESAQNMTDRFAALGAAVTAWTAEAPRLLDQFRARFTADPLVLDKWLMLNAIAPDDGVVARIGALLASPDFPRSNPNRMRALVGGFGMSNPAQFARADGAGFRFVIGAVAGMDTINPQVAARLLTAFRVWRSFEPSRRGAAESALLALKASGPLSRNVSEILDRTLAG